MSLRLEKLAAERERARKKRDEWDLRMKELDRKYHEVENSEIQDIVHAANLTPEMLAEILKNSAVGAIRIAVSSQNETPAEFTEGGDVQI